VRRPVAAATADAFDGGDAAAPFVLPPLDEPATSQIVERWLPAADPYTVAAIHSQAGGVPLFVEELAQSRLAAAAWYAMRITPAG